MSDLPMKQEDHPAHNMPEPTQAYSGDVFKEHTDARSMLEDRNRTAEYEGVNKEGDTMAWKGPK